MLLLLMTMMEEEEEEEEEFSIIMPTSFFISNMSGKVSPQNMPKSISQIHHVAKFKKQKAQLQCIMDEALQELTITI
jgi:hypothetical protein